MAIVGANVVDEMADAYVAYAQAVNMGRAIPNAVDGLKPVQRRVLLSMADQALWHSKPYKKSARITGDVMARYHPHCLAADTQVYLLDNTSATIKELTEAGGRHVVLAFNERTKRYEAAVAHSFRLGQRTKSKYVIKFANGKTVECTANHRFLADGEWVRADELKAESRLEAADLIDNGPYRSAGYLVESVELLALDEPEQFYDFTVDSLHNLCLDMGDGDLLVAHNSSAYGTLVGLASVFLNRHPLCDGHGNWGTLTDGAAAERYTEVRLTEFAEQVLLQHRKALATVPTYDNSGTEPITLAARLPMLLLRETSGIGVASACSHVSYNLSDVVKLCKAVLRGNCFNSETAYKYVRTPDFAMGGFVKENDPGLKDAIVKGKGSFRVFSDAHVEGNCIVATNLPQGVAPEKLLQETYEAIKSGVLQRSDFVDIRDETDRSGTRVVWECKKHVDMYRMLAALETSTSLVKAYSVHATAVNNGKLELMSVFDVVSAWADHRETWERKKLSDEETACKHRVHILIGLVRALENVDRVIALLREDGDLTTLGFTKSQADAIEAMTFSALRKQSMSKLKSELETKRARIHEIYNLLTDKNAFVSYLCKDLTALARAYGNNRRTGIRSISEEHHRGYVKLQSSAPKRKTKEVKGYFNWRMREDGEQRIWWTPNRKRYKFNFNRVEATNRDWFQVLCNDGKVYKITAAELIREGDISCSLFLRLRTRNRDLKALHIIVNGVDNGELTVINAKNQGKRIKSDELLGVSRKCFDFAPGGAIAVVNTPELTIRYESGRISSMACSEFKLQNRHQAGLKVRNEAIASVEPNAVDKLVGRLG